MVLSMSQLAYENPVYQSILLNILIYSSAWFSTPLPPPFVLPKSLSFSLNPHPLIALELYPLLLVPDDEKDKPS